MPAFQMIKKRTRPGMSLVELLVVVAVLTVLLGLLLPVLSAVKQDGRMTVEMSAGRQLMTAYINYSASHQGLLLPGYRAGASAWDAAGRPVDPIAAARYPWRLAPYLDYAIRGFYTNENLELLETFENQPELYQYAVSVFPSFGLNATWLGGDSRENAFSRTFLGVFGKYYVTRMTEAKRPERIVAFASAHNTDTFGALGPGVFEGFFVVRSPWFIEERWTEEYDADDPPADHGFVSFRYRAGAVSAFLDGHVDVLSVKQLRDMRRWANDATWEDWRLTPRGTSSDPLD